MVSLVMAINAALNIDVTIIHVRSVFTLATEITLQRHPLESQPTLQCLRLEVELVSDLADASASQLAYFLSCNKIAILFPKIFQSRPHTRRTPCFSTQFL